MRVAYVVPGSGGGFYCENCVRDGIVINALKDAGISTMAVSMYLPLYRNDAGFGTDAPVFFGAVNMYLSHAIPALQTIPGWLRKIFDSRQVLDVAARLSSATEAEGMESLTLEMLRGTGDRSELDRLVRWFHDERIELVHLSNALLTGLAGEIKERLGIPVVCSIQDEDVWIDALNEESGIQAWRIITENSASIDTFVAVSEYYKNRIVDQTGIPVGKITVLYPGIDPSGYRRSSLPADPPVIGFLSRLSEENGVGLLLDAFCLLRGMSGFEETRLLLSGGIVGRDRAFVRRTLRECSAGLEDEALTIVESFDRDSRISFLERCTVLSVPVPTGEAFGLHQLEAFSAGVPVVQPRVGAFPEIIHASGGGVLFDPVTPEALAESLAATIRDRGRLESLAAQGFAAARGYFNVKRMVRELADVYERNAAFDGNGVNR